MIRNLRSVRACTLMVFGVFLLVSGNSTAQASHKDDEIIVCTSPDNCFPQGDSSDDPSGADASGILSYGSGDPTPSPPSSNGTVTGPQVVTTATPTTSPAATTTVPVKPTPKVAACTNLPDLSSVPVSMNRDSATGTCTPKCLNHPDYTEVPLGWTVTEGNCNPPRGLDDYLICKGDLSKLVDFNHVDTWLNDGYGMGIWVDGVPTDRHGNCLITDLATYGIDPTKYVFSGMYVQDGGPGDGPGGRPFGTPNPPYQNWKPLYAYWVPRSTAAQYVAIQSTESMLAYGLLWYNGSRYQTANSFAKYLKKHHQRWLTWKKHHPDLAAALLTHQRLLRRR